MAGRDRGNYERIITLAHQVESMARQKSLKGLDHYLGKAKQKAKPKTRAQVEVGAAQVLAMFKRLHAQDAKKAAQSRGGSVMS